MPGPSGIRRRLVRRCIGRGIRLTIVIRHARGGLRRRLGWRRLCGRRGSARQQSQRQDQSPHKSLDPCFVHHLATSSVACRGSCAPDGPGVGVECQGGPTGFLDSHLIGRLCPADHLLPPPYQGSPEQPAKMSVSVSNPQDPVALEVSRTPHSASPSASHAAAPPTPSPSPS